MKRKNVPKEMQNKVQKYLDYLFENNNETIAEENGALHLLSENLQEELKREINGKVLREDFLFQVVFGTKFLAIVSKTLEEKIYSPGEIVFDVKRINFKNKFFIGNRY